MRMVEPKQSPTLDNWFTSIPLALKLREEKKLTLVGIFRENKREVPPNFLHDKNREEKSSIL